MKTRPLALAPMLAALALPALAGELTMPHMPLHDPYVVADQASKTYYLYTSNVPSVSGECGTGIMAYTSRDLKTWAKPKVVFKLPAGGWANGGAWAPEVHTWRGKYYLFTTLHNEGAALDKPSDSGWPAYRRGTVMAVADTPDGPFTVANGGEPVAPRDLMTLDGTLYVDKQGNPSYVYAHEWIQTGDGTIEALPLTKNLKPAGPPALLFKASSAPWSNGQRPVAPNGTPAKTNVYVTDGPQLYASNDGSLLMLWSSYDRNGYVQSVARSPSGKLAGPWEQLEPIVRRDSGHGMLFDTFDGKRMLVVHRPFKNARGKLYEVRDAGGRIEILNQRVDLDGDHVMAASAPPERDHCGPPAA
ncbi:glycoside hydrolase family 43 protein [Massilia sp. METH4]|uniref:glycoside hydrolase family 43 protein n=1 Tax=Massilia sp. METH4 TaxID=3123041 RepID=UPI0030D49702